MKQNNLRMRIFAFAIALVLIVTGFSGCGQTSDMSYEAGTYTATVDGRNGEVVVEVAFTATQIEQITVLEQSETAGLGDAALEKVKEAILESQSLAVDTVSGATVSSAAMLSAVEDCVIQAGGDVATLKAGASDDGNVETVTLEADVVVVGAGASGVSAAVAAGDEGAKVILIEKTGSIGGASNLSWAGKFIDSSAAIENGLKVDQEKMISDWIENNHWRVDSAAIRQYVAKSGETYDWLKDKGYVTQFLNFFGEQLHMLPDYGTREETLRRMLDESVVSGGGQVLTETTGKSLVVNESGDVTGIVAEQADGTILEISADCVVIATGGYAANAEMVKENFGFEGINGGLGQNVGEGLEMAWAAGAKIPDNFGGQMLHQTLARATTDLRKTYEGFEASYPLMLSYMPMLMNVNTSGARFRDEAFTLEAVAAANSSAFNGPYHLVIVSKAQIDALVENGLSGINAARLPGMPPEFYMDFADEFTLDNPWTDAYEVFDKMVENGHGFKGDSIEELAENAGMDVAVFTEAFQQYENACEDGVDEAFGKSSDYLISYGEEGPYYAIIAEINNLGSVGGLLVNTKFQVLDDERVPVKGLYAVGLESEGVLFNDTYVGNGVGIGYAFTSGRIGGESAAGFALGQ